MPKNPKQDNRPEKVRKAEDRISLHLFDTESWNVLVRDSQMKRIEDTRPFYEKLVSQFPHAGRYWKIYIEHEMKSRNYEKVEKLFQRCLMKVLNIDLWKTYLHYIKETKGKLPSYREKMAQAFDFALDKIGMDVQSYSIWIDYAAFLKSVEAVGSYAENQRITAVRKVYQRGVCNPMIGIEQLWKDYCSYENNINPLIAKKMIEDRGRDYVNARRVAKEYEVITKGLNKNRPSVPPQNSAEEMKQVDLWKKYIAWEKSNPLRTEDYATSAKRVMFAYEQCLLCLSFNPDIWNEAATYLEQTGKILSEKGDQNAGKLFADEAAAMYERAITTVLKSNHLLHFAYADFEESRTKYEKVHSIYKKLLNDCTDPTLVYIQYMKFARRAEGIKTARLVFKAAREDTKSGYQVFVAAALMEYFCSKDKSVAFKIFELGLKKYGHISEYIMEYLNYMSYVNEDNNTRVLYERVLTSGQLPSDKSRDIWDSFLDFEANVGDLASVIKVEKRRAQALGMDSEVMESAQVIDRYKYCDLYPCSVNELTALGYQIKSHGTVSDASTTKTSKKENEESLSKPSFFTRPDFGQMIPYKPLVTAGAEGNTLIGGRFAPPPVVADLLKLIPPPNSFTGPHVNMDVFYQHLKDMQVGDGKVEASGNEKEPSPTENGTANTSTDMDIEMDPGTKYSSDIASGKKRRVEKSGSDDESDNIAPPINDIWRQRQQKRVK